MEKNFVDYEEDYDEPKEDNGTYIPNNNNQNWLKLLDKQSLEAYERYVMA